MKRACLFLLLAISLSSARIVEGTPHGNDLALTTFDLGVAIFGSEALVSTESECIYAFFDHAYIDTDDALMIAVFYQAGFLKDDFGWFPPTVSCCFSNRSFSMSIADCADFASEYNPEWTYMQTFFFVGARLSMVEEQNTEGKFLPSFSSGYSGTTSTEPSFTGQSHGSSSSTQSFDPINTIRPDVVSSVGATARIRLLRDSDLAQLSYREIKLVRNYIYACYDRPFAVDWINDYFLEHMSGYQGNGPSDPVLTETENENITMIQEYERINDIPVIDCY
jgi:hypothetical protein